MSIESDYFQRTVAMIKEHWFPSHVASIVKYEVTIWRATDPPIHSLIWAKPGTSTYLVRYLLLNSTLIVTGDIGSAIYRWGHDKDMGFEWIAKCDFQYFASKIEGLNRGESREWHPDVCEQRASEFFKGKHRRVKDWDSYSGFASEWSQYIHDNEKLFGGFEGCSHAAEWGLVPSNRCIGHWMGLRLAMGVEKP
jgi:hypothetical protein